MIGLGTLAGGSVFGEARAASGDGAVIVGWTDSADGYQAFRWIGEGPMEGLGDLAGGPMESRALAVREDGSVIVGWGRTERGREAMWWTQREGPRRVHDVAVERGVVIPDGWVLAQATGISADGRTIVGVGTNPAGDTEAWRLELPPSDCPADLDASATVDFGDVLLVLGAWGERGGSEDLDGNGTVDFGDLLLILEAWGACP
jgi:probable HAF family extracellular repeat protein